MVNSQRDYNQTDSIEKLEDLSEVHNLSAYRQRGPICICTRWISVSQPFLVDGTLGTFNRYSAGHPFSLKQLFIITISLRLCTKVITWGQILQLCFLTLTGNC